ncbi:hypothetical protein [Burkholderia sp. AW49-1]
MNRIVPMDARCDAARAIIVAAVIALREAGSSHTRDAKARKHRNTGTGNAVDER